MQMSPSSFLCLYLATAGLCNLFFQEETNRQLFAVTTRRVEGTVIMWVFALSLL